MKCQNVTILFTLTEISHVHSKQDICYFQSHRMYLCKMHDYITKLHEPDLLHSQQICLIL